MTGDSSCLWVVATPIGNLDDISARAVSVLRRVSAILCEDTRVSRVLLRHLGIERPLWALHEHNERARGAALIALLKEGKELALISDAGTPLISDPGYVLVAAARAEGITVRPIPGASALLCALSVSGLPTDRFSFEGFLPAQAKARLERMRAQSFATQTLLYFEAPHRLAEFLSDAQTAFGPERKAYIARELTKLHESHYSGGLQELAQRCANEPNMARGELVIAIHGAPEAAIDHSEAERVHRLLRAELPPSQAAKLAAKITGLPRAHFYETSGKP